jgi:aspartyl-tRNA(Asn)/glutamyl-tRNA(Gln) amidotransferase subunit C
MSISPKNVEEMARLARISIDSEDIPSYSEQLSKILNFVNQMQSIDTETIEPLAHPIEEVNPTRAHIVTEKDTRQNARKYATHLLDDFYTVPQVID